MATLAELLKPRSDLEWLDDLIELIRAKAALDPFNVGDVDDWFSGGVYRTLLEVDASAVANLDAQIPVIVQNGYLETASGLFLDVLAFNQYGILRDPSLHALGRVVLTDTGSTGPHDIPAASLWVTNASGRRFLVLNSGTVPEGGSLIVTAKAEQPGAAFNISNNTLTGFVTPIPGLTVNNPPIPGSNPPDVAHHGRRGHRNRRTPQSPRSLEMGDATRTSRTSSRHRRLRSSRQSQRDEGPRGRRSPSRTRHGGRVRLW
ncbi:MAG: hypothetical protein HC933_20015 [Pleurocapsa sp. SU_196_0]|nr:hypothetical protein [Pleurocapsa sp. SU_196_0]